MQDKKAQTWSIDLIIAVVIFILIIAIFYTLLVREPKADIADLKSSGKYIGDKINTQLGSGDCAFMKDNEIDPEKLERCFNSDPEKFMRENNINSKFCIFVIDQNGRLITVGSSDNARVGFGYSELNISGTLCGTNFTSPP
ncbi:MAG: hypothetical protein V1743_07280 [Nanoarchaeota archaeon]